ncbi:MAG: hypothetical protein COB38_09805 [Gammaproteobacteria bacterium]|nr:MAG: hypothetical protein COB38_09805 [Gammaproteobacteria bacterium]
MTNTTKCLNCNSELTGSFCSHCGQSIKSRRGPIWQVAKQFSDDIFSIDSKVIQSLFVLLVKPGQLSKQFLDGRRASVLPPVRLYLVVSILFFFIFQIPSPDVSNKNVYIGDILLGKEKADKDLQKFSLIMFETGEKASVVENWINGIINEKEALMKSTNAQITINNMFNNLESVLPNLLILFLPLFAIILKGLYLFKRSLYFDHLIFLLHFQTWLMGAILIIYGLALQNGWWSALSIFIPIYLAKAQKTVYSQSYWLIIPKTILILISYCGLLIIAGIIAFLSAVTML